MLVIPEGFQMDTLKDQVNGLIEKDFTSRQGVRNPLVKAWEHPGGSYAGQDVYEDKYLFNVSNKTKPSVVHRDLQPMSEEDGFQYIYPGAIVNAWLTLVSYDRGSAGVGGYLEGIQYVGKGPRLDSKPAASSMFKPLESSKGNSSNAFLDIS